MYRSTRIKLKGTAGFWPLVEMQTEALLAKLETLQKDMHSQKQLRAMVLIELVYRTAPPPPSHIYGRLVRDAEMNALVWAVVFGDEVPPPIDLIAPSAASPYMRDWAKAK